MRKIARFFVVCLILGLAAGTARATDIGRWAVTMQIMSIRNDGNDMKFMDFDVTDNNISQHFFTWQARPVHRNNYASFPNPNPNTLYFSIDKRPTSIRFFTRRAWRAGFGTVNTNIATKIFNVNTVSPAIINQQITTGTDGQGIFLQCTSLVLLTLQPDIINFFNAAGTVNINKIRQDLPNDDYIKIQATSGFTANSGNVYQWQYATGSASVPPEVHLRFE